MKSIRKLPNTATPKKTEQSITKTGKLRKVYTVKNPRKKETKQYSLNLALTLDQKLFLETKAEELGIRPAEVIRKILEVFCRDMVLINKLSKDFNIFVDGKEEIRDSNSEG